MPNELETLLNNPEYQKRFIYRETKRPEKRDAAHLSIGQMGHMVETLADAAMIMQQLANDPCIDPTKNPSTKTYFTQSPAYMNDFARDIRLGAAFQHSDQPLPRLKPNEMKHLTLLTVELHKSLRELGREMGKEFKFPAHIEKLAKLYKDNIMAYIKMIKRNEDKPPPSADPGDVNHDHAKVDESEMQAYYEGYNKIKHRLFSALRELKTVQIGDGVLNNKKRLNLRLPDSYPAPALYGLKSFGSLGTDFNFRPIGEAVSLIDMIGTESLITDTMEALHQAAPFKSDLDRAQLQKLLTTHLRDLQLTLEFCRAADCGYGKLYQDLGIFIAMAQPEQKPVFRIGELQTPIEAALMLYAIERRFARKGNPDPALQKNLRTFADKIYTCANISEIKADIGSDMEFHRLLSRSKALVDEKKWNGTLDAPLKLLAVLQSPARTGTEHAVHRNGVGRPAML